MSKKNSQTLPSSKAPEEAAADMPGKSSEVSELLAKAAALLEQDQPSQALNLISRAKLKSAWATNALGVCQLRLGNSKIALDVFRNLALGGGGIMLRPDIPTVFKTNFAVALLASDNLQGCLRILAEVKNDSHPAVARLQGAIDNWKNKLSFLQKLNLYTGGQPKCPVNLGFPPGDLE